MILLHLCDPDSPKATLQVTNPGYVSPEKWQTYTKEEKADNHAMWGDNYRSPTIPMELASYAYCGIPLEQVPKKAPEFLYECLNYIAPCDILDYPAEEVCWKCVNKLDDIRDQEGYGPVIEFLKRQEQFGYNICICSKFILMKTGCRCNGV